MPQRISSFQGLEGDYDPTSGALLFDIDGTGAIASVQIATLSNLSGLTAASIVVV